MIDNAPQLIEQEPKKYLSLFPTSRFRGRGRGVSRRCRTSIVLQRPVAAQTLRRVEGAVRRLGGPGQRQLQLEKVAGVARSLQGSVSGAHKRKPAFCRMERRRRRRRAARRRRDRRGQEEPALMWPIVSCSQSNLIQPRDLLPLLKLLGEHPLKPGRFAGKVGCSAEMATRAVSCAMIPIFCTSLGRTRHHQSTRRSVQ